MSSVIIFKRFIFILAALLIFAGSVRSVAFAEGESGDAILQVTNAMQPERPPSMLMSAGYLSVRNLSENDVFVVNVTSPEYQSVSVHRSFEVDGMHKMEEVCPLKIPAGQQLTFEPGGLHLMLHKPLVSRKAGDQTTIIFETDKEEMISFKLLVVRH